MLPDKCISRQHCFQGQLQACEYKNVRLAKRLLLTNGTITALPSRLHFPRSNEVLERVVDLETGNCEAEFKAIIYESFVEDQDTDEGFNYRLN